MTHGAETAHGFMHAENLQYCWPTLLASNLGTDVVNLALCGGDNDYIFHSLIDAIESHASQETHSVIAAWTSPIRLYWQNKGRHWFFIPGWASSMKNLYDWEFNQHATTDAFITSDSKDLLDLLESQHRFFIDNYLDDLQYHLDKLGNYRVALKSLCQSRGIKFVDFVIFDIKGPWQSQKRHPNIQEHQLMALEIQKKFY